MAPPLDLAAFSLRLDRLGPFEPRPVLAVAVSGGPDSLALALLAQAWAEARGGSLLSLTVDHGLRPGSAEEAAQVGAWLGQRGIAHRTLRWDGPKPTTGVQEAARTARYRLLEATCAAAGVLHLLLGHHRDDQSETLTLRAERQSGVDGRAAMPAIRETAVVRLLRPLLDVPKVRLIATCRAAGQSWIEDPGNRAPHFARGRLRRDGGVADRFAEVLAAGLDRAARDDAMARLAARHLTMHPEGWAELAKEAAADAGPDLFRRLLARLLAAVGGGAHPPRGERLDRLVTAMNSDAPLRAGLAGCIIAPTGTGWRLVRELRGLPEPTPLLPGQSMHWDNRFKLDWTGAHPVELGALGAADWAALRRDDRLGSAAGLPAEVGAALPALRLDGRLLCVLHLRDGPLRNDDRLCKVVFRPLQPAAGPRFAVVSPGAEII